MVDYQKVFLSPSDLSILDDLSNGSILVLHEVRAEFLLSIGFIAHYALSNDKNLYVITSEGKRFKDWFDGQLSNTKQKMYRDRIRTWIPVIISNILALIALIVSILK